MQFSRRLFSPCGAVSLSVRLRAAFGSSTREEDITFEAFNSSFVRGRAGSSAELVARRELCRDFIEGCTVQMFRIYYWISRRNRA
jgi:hypothetical protein